MGATRRPDERQVEADPLSGATVTRLTAQRGHSQHLYFTEDGWIDGGRRLLIGSDRGGATDLYAVDLVDGSPAQLTALPAGSDVAVSSTSIDRVHGEACTWVGRDLIAAPLSGGHPRTLWRCPDGFLPGLTTCDAAGGLCYAALSEEDGRPRSAGAYAGYRERFAQRLRSRIVAVPTDGAAARVLHEDVAWITHVNASPTVPARVLFCHEGPWDAVQRMWALDAGSGRTWPVRPRDGVVAIGHEYWLRDGSRIGYHARIVGDDRRHLLGFVDWDVGGGWDEAGIAVPTQHSHANDQRLVVLDSVRWAGDHLLIVERVGQGFGPPRLLCTHGTSRHHHHAHAHPRFSPDGRSVVFTSDRSGYAQVHVVALPDDLASLPAWPGPPARFYWM